MGTPSGGSTRSHEACGGCDQPAGTELLWTESSTNGASWTNPDRIAKYDWTYIYKDDPSIVWHSSTTRYVLVSAYGYADKTMLLRGLTAGLAPASVQTDAVVAEPRPATGVQTGEGRMPRGFSEAIPEDGTR